MCWVLCSCNQALLLTDMFGALFLESGAVINLCVRCFVLVIRRCYNLNIFLFQAVSITEAKLKMSDIPCAVHMCSLLHQRYPDFSMVLLENWNKVMPAKKDEKASQVGFRDVWVSLRLTGVCFSKPKICP